MAVGFGDGAVGRVGFGLLWGRWESPVESLLAMAAGGGDRAGQGVSPCRAKALCEMGLGRITPWQARTAMHTVPTQVRWAVLLLRLEGVGIRVKTGANTATPN